MDEVTHTILPNNGGWGDLKGLTNNNNWRGVKC